MTLPITAEQVALVQQSWPEVFPIRETAATLFYDRLFALDPSLRLLFPADMAAQGSKLFETLNAVVFQLDDLATLDRLARALGRSHAGYGATAGHYRTVRDALMWVLQGSLGVRFDAALQAAWAAAYDRLAAAMLEGSAAA